MCSKRYKLEFKVPGHDWSATPAARDVDWKLLLGMVALWRRANPDCQLRASYAD